MHGSLRILFIIGQQSDFVCPVYTSVRRTILRFYANQLIVCGPGIFMEITQISKCALRTESCLQRLCPFFRTVECRGDVYQFARPQTIIILDNGTCGIVTGSNADFFTGCKCKVPNLGTKIGYRISNVRCQLDLNGFTISNCTIEGNIHILAIASITCGDCWLSGNGIRFFSNFHEFLARIHNNALWQQVNYDRIRKVDRLSGNVLDRKCISDWFANINSCIRIRTIFRELDFWSLGTVYQSFGIILGCQGLLRFFLTC